MINGGGGITKQGAGITTLSAQNTFNGPTLVNAGTLLMGIANAIANSSSLNVANGAIFNTGGFNQTVGDLTGSGNITLGGGSVLTFGTNNVIQQVFLGNITGSGGLIKQGTGTVILSGVNIYSGGTVVNAGILQGNSSSLQGNITNNATVVFNQTTTGTYGGIISGVGNLITQNNGIIIFSNVNTYTGSTQVNGGTLRMGILNAIATTSGLNVAAGTFDLNGFNQIVGDLTGVGAITLGASVLTFGTNNGAAQTFSGVISGTGGITKQGTGIAILSNNNSYTGPTVVNGGTLRMGAVNAIANTSGLSVATGIFDLNGLNQTVGDLTGAGAITLGVATLTFGTNNGAAQTFSGNIAGTGNIIKQGTGTAIFLGANTYIGGTTINSGALQGNSLSLQGNIANNATIIFDQTGTGTYASVISGSGNFIKQNSGTLFLTNIHSFTGGAAVNGGILVLSSGGTLNTPVSINSGGTVSLSSGGTLNNPVTVNQGGTFIFNEGTLNSSLYNAGTVMASSPNTIGGSYTQTGTLALQAMSETSFVQLMVSGNVVLGGNITRTLLNEVGSLIQNGQTFNIIETSGGAITYNNLTVTQVGYSSALLSFLVDTPTPQILQLTAVRNELFNVIPMSEMAYLEGVSTALEDIRMSQPAVGSLQEKLLDAIDQSALQGMNVLTKDLGQLTPTQVANGATIRDIPLVLQSNSVQPIANRLDALRSGINRFPAVVAYAPAAGYAAGDASDLGNHISMGPLLFNGVGKQGIVNSFPGYHFDTKGFGMFSDLNLAEYNATFGLAVNHSHTTVKNDDGTSMVQMLTPQGTLYGDISYGNTGLDGAIYLEGIFAYGRSHNRSRRYVNFLSEMATGKYWSQQIFGRVQLGFTPYADIFEFSPFVLWQDSMIKLAAFTESGAPMSNLTVSSRKVDTVSGGAGLRIAYVQHKDTWLPEFHLKFLHDFKVTKLNVVSQFLLGGPAFSTFVPPAQKNSINAGLSFTASLTESCDMTAGYDFDLKGKFSSHSGAVRLRWKF